MPFKPNFLHALTLQRSGLGEFSQILTDLSARGRPKFSFPDDILSKCQKTLTKLVTYIGIKEIWFRIASGQNGGCYSLTFYFSVKTYLVGTSWKCPGAALLIGIHEEIRKKNQQLWLQKAPYL